MKPGAAARTLPRGSRGTTNRGPPPQRSPKSSLLAQRTGKAASRKSPKTGGTEFPRAIRSNGSRPPAATQRGSETAAQSGGPNAERKANPTGPPQEGSDHPDIPEEDSFHHRAKYDKNRPICPVLRNGQRYPLVISVRDHPPSRPPQGT